METIITGDYAGPSDNAESAPESYLPPIEDLQESESVGSDYAPPISDGSSVGPPQGYLSPIGDSLPAYGSAEELPNYIVEDSMPLNNDYAAPNGYLSPIHELSQGAKPISGDYAGPSNAEQAPDGGYSPPIEELQGSQPIATDYAPPSAGESAPNGYLPPIMEENDKEPSKAEGYSYPVPDNSLELPERPQNEGDDQPIANDYAGPNAESAAPDAGYLPPNIDESKPVGSGYAPPDESESAPNASGYLPPIEESSQDAKPITGIVSIFFCILIF